MITTVIGAYPKPQYLILPDWFNAKGGTDTENPTSGYAAAIRKLGDQVEEFFLKATIKEPVNIAIPIYKILSICSSLGDENLYFNISGTKIEIKTEFGEYNIMGQSSEDFPDKITINENQNISFDSKKMEELIKYTIDSTSTDDLKPSLQGILFDINEAKTTLVSTDGHRLSKI